MYIYFDDDDDGDKRTQQFERTKTRKKRQISPQCRRFWLKTNSVLFKRAAQINVYTTIRRMMAINLMLQKHNNTTPPHTKGLVSEIFFVVVVLLLIALVWVTTVSGHKILSLYCRVRLQSGENRFLGQSNDYLPNGSVALGELVPSLCDSANFPPAHSANNNQLSTQHYNYVRSFDMQSVKKKRTDNTHIFNVSIAENFYYTTFSENTHLIRSKAIR